MTYLTAQGITKRYGHVAALRGADFSADLGEIVALIGDNGAGKSTLVKTLSGAIAPDAGQIFVDGEPVTFDSPESARAAGIETVYQDLALADDLSPEANLFLGRELLRTGFMRLFGTLDHRAMHRRARAEFAAFNLDILQPGKRVSDLSGGQRQSIAVARAAVWAQRIVFLDEPTAALGVIQTKAVHDLIKRVRDQGIGVVLISHNMPEVIEIADRIQVMRFGEQVASLQAADATVEALVYQMTSGQRPGASAGEGGD